jgi:hypothetical protein
MWQILIDLEGLLLCIFITEEVDNFLENKIDPTAIFVDDN